MAVSTLGVVLFVLLAPGLLPVWGFKSVSGTFMSHLGALKLNTEVLAGLALAGDYIKDARCQLDEERENLAVERDAFLEFADEVQSLPAASGATGGTTTIRVSNTRTGRGQLEQVKKAYEETVMAVPDFDQEYGESFAEHIAAEFGTDVATVVVNGHRFSEPIKQLLVEQARQSAEQRQELLEAIGTEERSLRAAASNLDPTRELLESVDEETLKADSIAELVDADSELQESRGRCESVLETRQTEIQSRANQITASGTFVQEYLYRSVAFSFPVLQTGLEYVEAIDERRELLVQTLVEHP